MSEIVLTIGAQRYRGWKRIGISRGIEQLSGGFSLACADRWAIAGEPLPQLKDQACTLSVDDQVIISGWIDSAPPRYDGSGHELLIRGRDSTGDLIDSSAELDGSGSVGLSLKRIAEKLCAPFAIPVTVDAAAAADAALVYKYQHLQPGETCAEVLQRLAEMRGLLLVADSKGGLLITRAGATRASTALTLGENVLAADAEDSSAGRYHTYRVIAQDREDDFNADSAQQIVGRATDSGARSPRLLIIRPTEACDAAAAQRLAEWTCARRRALGERVRYTVRGWMDGDKPWQPNTIVHVDDPWARFDGDYLIVSVTHQIDVNGGEITELEVAPPDAFTPLKVQEQNPQREGREL